MIDIDEEETNDFNRIVVSMLEEIIRMDEEGEGQLIMNGILSFGYDSLVESMTIQNIMSVSMDEEIDKVLTKDDTIELEFTNNVYKKDDYGDHTCCVCLGDIEEEQYVYMCDNCRNINHYDCMNEWIKRKVECPTCRFDVKHNTIVKDDFVTFINNELDI
jgi:hypothetical protein